MNSGTKHAQAIHESNPVQMHAYERELVKEKYLMIILG